MGVFSLIGDSAKINFFTEYAQSDGRDGQACAQAVLKFVFGIEHNYPVKFPNEGEGNRLFSSDSPIIVDNPNIKLYPNPTNSLINIEFTSEIDSKITLEVKDLLGRTILTKLDRKENLQSVSLNEIGNGMYMLTIYDSNLTLLFQTKLIKQ